MPAVRNDLARSWLPEAALGLTILIWGSTFLVTKAAFTHLSVLAFISLRFGLMTAMAFVILWVVARRSPGLRWAPPWFSAASSPSTSLALARSPLSGTPDRERDYPVHRGVSSCSHIHFQRRYDQGAPDERA